MTSPVFFYSFIKEMLDCFLEVLEMYLVTYDIGNSFIKAALTKISDSIEFVGATVTTTHSTTTLGGKGVEQSTEQWWDSICRSTKELLKNYSISMKKI